MSIKYGECLYIPFYNGESIADSQLRPRMYKTKDAFEKIFSGHKFRNAGIELVKYVPVVNQNDKNVLRCKQCIFSSYNSCNDTYRCTSQRGLYRIVDENEFCSWGEVIDSHDE